MNVTATGPFGKVAKVVVDHESVTEYIFDDGGGRRQEQEIGHGCTVNADQDVGLAHDQDLLLDADCRKVDFDDIDVPDSGQEAMHYTMHPQPIAIRMASFLARSRWGRRTFVFVKDLATVLAVTSRVRLVVTPIDDGDGGFAWLGNMARVLFGSSDAIPNELAECMEQLTVPTFSCMARLQGRDVSHWTKVCLAVS